MEKSKMEFTKDLWAERSVDLYDQMLLKSLDAWKEESDKDLLHKITEKMSEYEYKYKYFSEQNKPAIARNYKNSIKYYASQIEEKELKSSSFLKEYGASIISKLINETAKEMLLNFVLADSMNTLPSEEKSNILNEVSKIFENTSSQNTNTQEAIMSKLEVEQVEALLKPVIEKLLAKDANYFSVVFEAVTVLMKLVNDVKEMTGAEKKAFCIQAFKHTYMKFDPDLPWISGAIENAVEEYLLNKLLPAAIDAIFLASNQGLFKKSE